MRPDSPRLGHCEMMLASSSGQKVHHNGHDVACFRDAYLCPDVGDALAVRRYRGGLSAICRAAGGVSRVGVSPAYTARMVARLTADLSGRICQSAEKEYPARRASPRHPTRSRRSHAG